MWERHNKDEAFSLVEADRESPPRIVVHAIRVVFYPQRRSGGSRQHARSIGKRRQDLHLACHGRFLSER